MSLVRTTALLRSALRVENTVAKRPMSAGAWSYRVMDQKPTRNLENLGAAVGAFTWWWMLWGIWSEPDHILGEFPYPDPSKWSDAELGIPPDDE